LAIQAHDRAVDRGLKKETGRLLPETFESENVA
jgi:hypothetical protein